MFGWGDIWRLDEYCVTRKHQSGFNHDLTKINIKFLPRVLAYVQIVLDLEYEKQNCPKRKRQDCAEFSMCEKYTNWNILAGVDPGISKRRAPINVLLFCPGTQMTVQRRR